MPNRRLSLRKIKEILRLKLECGISEREISRSCQVSRSTIADYLRRATAAKLTWTEASLLPENQIEERLFPTEHVPSSVKRLAPDCEYIYNQLRTFQKFNLTLSQLWIEYKAKYPDGYQYTQFCEHYCRWRKSSTIACARSTEAARNYLLITPMDCLSSTPPPVNNAYPVICRRLGRFQLHLCGSHDVTNITGVDQLA